MATEHETADETFTDGLDTAETNTNASTGYKRLETVLINSPEKLKACVDIMFTKVLEEPAKHSVLARLCEALCKSVHGVKWTEEGTNKETSFKKELLSKCQAELDKVKKDDDEEFEPPETCTINSSEDKHEHEREHQERVSRARKRTLSLFSFCGNLYSVKVVSENTMHECLVRLLFSPTDEEYLKAFCSLISVIGPFLDASNSKTRMNRYFERITDILRKKKVSFQMMMMLEDVIRLRENKWMQKRKTPCWARARQLASGKEQKETPVVLGKFQAILNKLTSQKFQRLAEQALELEFNTVETLKGCVDLIISRIQCCEERIYIGCYAGLCKELSTKKVSEEKGGEKATYFRRELLIKLQAEFEKDRTFKCTKLSETSAEADTSGKRTMPKNELEECRIKHRARSLSNVTFIGELYNLSMIAEKSVHECIVRLLTSSTIDEESLDLECFAALITVAGRELDIANKHIDEYFIQVTDIIWTRWLSTRINFMLNDVLDLRKNGWVPRRHQVTTLKTIDEIHEDAVLEEMEAELQIDEHESSNPVTQKVSENHPTFADCEGFDTAKLVALKSRKKKSVATAAPLSVTTPDIIPEVIRSIFSACVTGTGTSAVFDEELFKNMCAAELTEYENSYISLQVQVLNVLQTEFTRLEYPPMLLSQMIRRLIGMGIIRKEAFKEWRRMSKRGRRATCL